MNILEFVAGLIGESPCEICGRDDLNGLCEACRFTLSDESISSCYICNAITVDYRVCKGCRHKSSLLHVWRVGDYDAEFKHLVRRLKFGGVRSLAHPLSLMMRERLPLDYTPLVIPLPTSTSRQRQRGFDQAELLAKQLRYGAYRRLLRRTKSHRQVGANREERFKQMKTAWRLINSADVKGKHILLVDDVVTTGATAESAARLLRNAGARSVSLVVIAKVS